MGDRDGTPVPHVVKMDPEARSAWAGWCQAHRDEREADDFPEGLDGMHGKLEAYAARSALVLHLMDLAADLTTAPAAAPPELPRRIIADAARLVAYFKSHGRRVFARSDRKAEAGNGDVRALLGWIGRNRRAGFSERDINQDFDRFKDHRATLSDALQWLIARNLIRQRADPADRKPGRKPSPAYDVNPEFWSAPRFHRFHRNCPADDRIAGNGGNGGRPDDSKEGAPQ